VDPVPIRKLDQRVTLSAEEYREAESFARLARSRFPTGDELEEHRARVRAELARAHAEEQRAAEVAALHAAARASAWLDVGLLFLDWQTPSLERLAGRESGTREVTRKAARLSTAIVFAGYRSAEVTAQAGAIAAGRRPLPAGAR
jgi:hypothetical protein